MKTKIKGIIGAIITIIIGEFIIISISIGLELLLKSVMDFKQILMLIGIITFMLSLIIAGIADKVYKTIIEKHSKD